MSRDDIGASSWPTFPRDGGDRPREECGVVAIAKSLSSRGSDDDGAAQLHREAFREAFYGLFALQHRGQEAAGIAVSDGGRIILHKALGLVSQVFGEREAGELSGHLAIGHTRYSTTGGPSARNAQPFFVETRHGPLALAHNGNLVNAAALRRGLLERGVGLSSASDTEVMVMMLAAAPGSTWPERIASCMREWVGAFSFVVLTCDAVYAARDPWGFRPLACGLLPGGGSAAASETCALGTLGCTEVRDIGPGRIVELGAAGVREAGGIEAAARGASCVFEYIYFSRPDSEWNGISVQEVRRKTGAILAAEAPVDADIVIAVPDSSISAAIGYAQASGLPYDEAFVKNRYIGRTFIEPTDTLRKKGVALKFNVMPGAIRGKRIAVVDDSIVRGTTTGPIVRLLREAGAAAVHVRIASPPIRHPCHMGVDMGNYEDLAAHRMDVGAIRTAVGADSLAFVSLAGLAAALGTDRARACPGHGYCLACFSGDYPVDVAGCAFKNGFESC